MRIYLACWLLEPQQGRALTKCNANDRLISYFHTLEKAEQLPRYVITGLNNPTTIKRNYEVWKDIKGFPGYQISCFGRVRSLDKVVNSKYSTRKRKGNILKPWKVNGGYLMISLFNEDKVRRLIHLLVIAHFGSPKPGPEYECNHIDGDKTNNWCNNLEWVTHQENTDHASRLGLRKIGQEHGMAILNEKEVLKIRKYAAKTSQIELAKLFGVTPANINAIIKRRIWKHI